MDAEYYMREALAEARAADAEGEVPVGAVIVRNGEIVGRGRNGREGLKNALAHAEVVAIGEACERLGGWRLWDCDLYVTLEPCPMCAGAIVTARIRNVYFGAWDPKAGCFGSVIDFNELPFNHKPEIISGVLEEECSTILTEHFKRLRESK